MEQFLHGSTHTSEAIIVAFRKRTLLQLDDGLSAPFQLACPSAASHGPWASPTKSGPTLAVGAECRDGKPTAMRHIGIINRMKGGHCLNNEAENSHLPLRRQERAIFLSLGNGVVAVVPCV